MLKKCGNILDVQQYLWLSESLIPEALQRNKGINPDYNYLIEHTVSYCTSRKIAFCTTAVNFFAFLCVFLLLYKIFISDYICMPSIQKGWRMKSVLKYYTKLDALLDAQIFFIALELDMFTVLSNGKTAEELAEVISCNADKYGSLNLGNAQSLKIFLDALAAQGLITVDGECYYNTDETQRFLARSSLSYIGDVLLYRKQLSDICNEAEAVSDKPSSCPVFDFTEMARITAKEISILRKQPLLTLIKGLGIMPKKVLDLGGGSGALLIAVAESYKKCEGGLFEQKDVSLLPQVFFRLYRR